MDDGRKFHCSRVSLLKVEVESKPDIRREKIDNLYKVIYFLCVMVIDAKVDQQDGGVENE